MSDADATRALHSRLRAVAAVLLDGTGGADGADTPDARSTPDLLVALVRDLQTRPSPSRTWLLWIAIATVWPRAGDLAATRRALELREPDAAVRWLLAACLDAARHQGRADAELELVTGAVVVDVDHTARHDVHTGIQRVVRSALPYWADHARFVPVAWTARRGGLRRLDAAERDRVLRWGDHGAGTGGAAAGDHVPPRLVVPWRSTLLLAEVPAADLCAPLAAAAEYSDNQVVVIGYDAIPVSGAFSVPRPETDRFARYLEVVKHARVVAAISASARDEFAGFAAMLATQGRTPPEVVECMLPSGTPPESPDPSTDPSTDDPPVIVSVGAFEPRKNQAALLSVAERLWREGLRFELRLIGGRGVDAATITRTVRAARRRGRAVSIIAGASEDELHAAYRQARFTVFASLHEGFGLPVAESLEHGAPVITSDLGSMREIAAGGGCLLVDPRDDDALADAMRRLLTDDVQLSALRAAIPTRAARTWRDYADELWALATTGTTAPG